MIPLMPHHHSRPQPPEPRCGSCRRPGGPFVLMENGRDYCVRCAVEIREVTGIASIDARADASRIR